MQNHQGRLDSAIGKRILQPKAGINEQYIDNAADSCHQCQRKNYSLNFVYCSGKDCNTAFCRDCVAKKLSFHDNKQKEHNLNEWECMHCMKICKCYQ